MNRRAFFSSMAALAAGAAFDPERLLFVPGKKLISIPKPRAIWEPVPSGYYPIFASQRQPRIGDVQMFSHPQYIEVKNGELMFCHRSPIYAVFLREGWSWRPGNPLGMTVLIAS